MDGFLNDGSAGSSLWWQTVKEQGTPLIMNGNEGNGLCDLLFLWRDPYGGAMLSPIRSVLIEVEGHTPHSTEALTFMSRLRDTDVWYWRTHLPADWLGSYVFVPVRAEHGLPPERSADRRLWWSERLNDAPQSDPHSPWPAQANGWGAPRSSLRLGARQLSLSNGGVPSGRRVQWTWHSPLLGRSRSVWLYAPPAPAGDEQDNPRPWVLLLDGQAWAVHQPLFDELDTWTREGRLPPAFYLAVDACDPEARWSELTCHRPFWVALHEELYPVAFRHASVGCERVRMIVAGQSLGGLAAAYAALHWPESYGAVLSQSGSFWWPCMDSGPEHAWLTQRVREGLGADGDVLFLLQTGRREDEDMR